MEVETLDNGTVQFTIHNESHTLLNPLVDILLERDELYFASYKHIHPLKSESALIVGLKPNYKKKTTELDVISEALDTFIEELAQITMEIE